MSREDSFLGPQPDDTSGPVEDDFLHRAGARNSVRESRRNRRVDALDLRVPVRVRQILSVHVHQQGRGVAAEVRGLGAAGRCLEQGRQHVVTLLRCGPIVQHRLVGADSLHRGSIRARGQEIGHTRIRAVGRRAAGGVGAGGGVQVSVEEHLQLRGGFGQQQGVDRHEAVLGCPDREHPPTLGLVLSRDRPVLIEHRLPMGCELAHLREDQRQHRIRLAVLRGFVRGGTIGGISTVGVYCGLWVGARGVVLGDEAGGEGTGGGVDEFGLSRDELRRVGPVGDLGEHACDQVSGLWVDLATVQCPGDAGEPRGDPGSRDADRGPGVLIEPDPPLELTVGAPGDTLQQLDLVPAPQPGGEAVGSEGLVGTQGELPGRANPGRVDLPAHGLDQRGGPHEPGIAGTGELFAEPGDFGVQTLQALEQGIVGGCAGVECQCWSHTPILEEFFEEVKGWKEVFRRGFRCSGKNRPAQDRDERRRAQLVVS
nr:hypothetical protein [Zhihengliuella halotolerans]